MTKRLSNIELLRIIAMLGIISLHFFGHGGVNYDTVTTNLYIREIMKGIFMVSVNVFVIISGYFLVESTFKASRIVKLLVQVLFYSIVIFIFLVSFNKFELTGKNLLYVFFPTLTNMDGFTTEYVLLYLLSPFLNKLINAITQKSYKVLLVILSSVFVLIPTLFCYLGQIYEFGGGYGIVWFIVLYLTGAYLRKYPISITKTKSILLMIGLLLLIPLSSICAIIIYEVTGAEIFFRNKELFYNYTSLLVYPASIFVFVFFSKLSAKDSVIGKIICFISSTTFGIYLIHDNRFLRKTLWSFINPNNVITDSKYMVLYYIVITLGIFIACLIIEKIRQILFEKIYGISKIKDKLTKLDEKITF